MCVYYCSTETKPGIAWCTLFPEINETLQCTQKNKNEPRKNSNVVEKTTEDIVPSPGIKSFSSSHPRCYSFLTRIEDVKNIDYKKFFYCFSENKVRLESL